MNRRRRRRSASRTARRGAAGRRPSIWVLLAVGVLVLAFLARRLAVG